MEYSLRSFHDVTESWNWHCVLYKSSALWQSWCHDWIRVIWLFSELNCKGSVNAPTPVLMWNTLWQKFIFYPKIDLDQRVSFLLYLWVKNSWFLALKTTKRRFLGWLTFYRLGWVEFYRCQKFKVGFAKMYILTKNGLLP